MSDFQTIWFTFSLRITSDCAFQRVICLRLHLYLPFEKFRAILKSLGDSLLCSSLSTIFVSTIHCLQAFPHRLAHSKHLFGPQECYKISVRNNLDDIWAAREHRNRSGSNAFGRGTEPERVFRFEVQCLPEPNLASTRQEMITTALIRRLRMHMSSSLLCVRRRQNTSQLAEIENDW